MTPKERFNAASQKHRDALQALLDKHKNSGPSKQIEVLTKAAADLKARLDALQADYDMLLTDMSEYLEEAAQQITEVDAADISSAAPTPQPIVESSVTAQAANAGVSTQGAVA
jgi:hypothetical protein